MDAQLRALQLDPERLSALEQRVTAAQSALGSDRERIRALKSRAEWADEAVDRLKDDTAAWLALGLLVRGSVLGERLGRLRQVHWGLEREAEAAAQEYDQLERVAALPLAQALALLGNLRDPAIAAGAQTLVTGPLGDLLGADRHEGLQHDLGAILEDLVVGLTRQKTEAGRGVDELHEAVAGHAAEIAALEARIAEEQRRVRRHQELLTLRAGLQAKQETLEDRIGVRQLAGELLAGAVHYISQRFNTEVRNLSADSLPRFTNGR
ncbi:MAG: hypothetical protein ACM3ST_12900 [Bdellovibrio bacteriovorus]